MTRMKRKPDKQRIAAIVLTILFLSAALIAIYQSNLKAELQLSIHVNVSNSTSFRLFNGKALVARQEINDTGVFRWVRFPLPKGEITDLRLDLGHKPGTVQLKYLKISGLFTFASYRLEGKPIRKVFTRTHGLKTHPTNTNRFILETYEGGSWIAPGNAFYKTLERMQGDKLFYYGLSLLAAFLFFLASHTIDISFLRSRVPAVVTVNGISIFLLVLALPLLKSVFYLPDGPELGEKRRLKPKPEFRFDSPFEFARCFTPYYSDHFALRNHLVYMNNLLKVKLFGISPSPGVLVGKKNWLFLHKQNRRPSTVDYFRALSPLTAKQLDDWKQRLEKRRDWLGRRGINYLFVVVPNKNTIYPEYMPDRIRRVNPVSRMDQLLEHLGQNSTVPFIDLRPALLEAKTHDPVYSATDTHWNDFGAYIAHREIIQYISRHFETFAGMTPLPLSRFKLEKVDRSGGDLAIMLSLQKDVLREDMIRLTPVFPQRARLFSMPNISRFIRQSRTEHPALPHPKVVMVHDSFYKKLRPYLSELFPRVLYIWDWDMGFFPGIIEREKPGLVINEMAERFLLQ